MSKAHDRPPRKHRTLKELLATEPRCIYCENTREIAKMTVEHMPPRSMFRDKLRLKGMEYATCEACNNGTKGADVVAAFLSRIGQNGSEDGWEIEENKQFLSGVHQSAPGVLEEVFNSGKARHVYVKTQGGVHLPMIKTQTGPTVKGYMDVFSAKLAMAVFREHIGCALRMDGRIETIWFLNAGLPEQTADAMLSILPTGNTLRQGKLHATEQFAYRYNTDEKEIVAALVGFHSNLHIFVMASSNPIYEGLKSPNGTNKCKPGQLLDMLPKKRSFVLPGLPGESFLLK